MSSPGFGVQSDVVGQHARTVAELAGQVEQAAQAAETTAPFGDAAYGLIGQLFAIAAQDTSSQAIHAVQAAGQVGRRAAHDLEATAASYRATEQAVTTMFGAPR